MSFWDAPQGTFDFAVNNWPSGVYFVEISTGTHRATDMFAAAI